MKLLLIALVTTAATVAHALGGNPNVRFSPSEGAFPIARPGQSASILVDAADWPGVQRAARDLQCDVAAVTGQRPSMGTSRTAIVIGTLGHSPTVDRLVREGKLDVRAIRFKWEASVTQVVNDPMPGVGQALVIAGADKRGTIYGIYDLSESIGVSPWAWWADVPVRRHAELYVKAGRTVAKSPAVKYRGIFLNDEGPSLSNWVYQNYRNYYHPFYERVFELLLRLRANYLWPAMWNNCFSQDDPLNPVKADEYGIVMGTSHVEPMMRADKEWNRLGYGEREWNYATHPKELEKFWADGIVRNKPYENLITVAMRGKIDTPMSETANIELLERIVAAQRRLIAEHINPDVSQVPQLWCLYKEVQEYYEKGMRVPDDVTLLWADDNWGNIRRLPTPEERGRSGGAGVYYHFDYVGGPRNYKWLDTNPLPKIWEQMNLAHAYGADRIWIVNVGDLKPMEFPLEFFLTMARDPKALPKEKIADYSRRWAAREFGPTYAAEIADIVSDTHRLAGRRKPELLEPGTYSIENYREADRVVEEYQLLVRRAETIDRKLPAEFHSAYFQLVLHPARANSIVNEMYVAAAKNALYAKQGRAETNEQAQRVRDLFAADAELTKEYHALNGGKWNHFMDQTHIGYTSWQEPSRNFMPRVQEITLPEAASMGVAFAGPELTFSRFGEKVKAIDVYNRGKTPFPITFKSEAPWLLVHGKEDVDQTSRLRVTIDWERAPTEGGTGEVVVTGASGTQRIPVRLGATPKQPKGFVEGDGVIAIEAANTTRRTAANGAAWSEIPGYGRTRSAMSIFPVTAPSAAIGKGARLEYNVFVQSGGKATLSLIASPSLGFVPGRGLRMAVAFDDNAPQVLDLAPAYLSRDWETAVKDAVVTARSAHSLLPGRHVLKVWAIDPGVVLQRFILDLGGLKPSYLGPPESHYVK